MRARYWGIVTLVVLYIQIVVFHIEGRHTFQEPGLAEDHEVQGQSLYKGRQGL